MNRDFCYLINNEGLAEIAADLNLGVVEYYAEDRGTPYGEPPKRFKVSEDFEPAHRNITFAYKVFVSTKDLTADDYNRCVAVHNQIEAQKEGNKVFMPCYLSKLEQEGG